MPYRLHYFPESGNSYKLALMLTFCGEQWEPVWTDFGGGATFFDNLVEVRAAEEEEIDPQMTQMSTYKKDKF